MARVAVVTGGMGGLGEAICIKLAALGDKVVATYSPGNKTAEEWLAGMKAQGFDFSAVPVDVTDFDSCAACVKQVEADIGPIDVLVNNAGITRDMTFKKMTKADWDAVIKTNLDSVFNMTKQVMDGMMARNWGRVVNISSVNGIKGAFGQTNYAAAKAGIMGFTKSMAREVGSRGITVNCVAPGFIDTDMTRALPQEQRDALVGQIALGRLGDAQDIADAVLFLASDKASYITGQTLHVNGGMLMP